MPEQWTSLAAAAAAMDVHTRTIERRIASGKMRTQRGPDGQVQVLIDLPDKPTESPGTAISPLETVKELAQDQISLATGSASAIVRLAQVDADRARSELARVRQESQRAQHGARTAWTTVAAMAACICVAVGWTTYHLTQSGDELRTLREKVNQSELTIDELQRTRDQARADAQLAQLKTAESAGRLAVYVEQARQPAILPGTSAGKASVESALPLLSDKRPTSQPTNLVQRIAAAFSNE